MEHDSLTHWGIKGMKWGVRRYQNKDGSLTPAGKKRYAEESEESPDEYEARKQKAVKSGTATEVLKFKGDLTQAEMQSAINRIRWEQDMAGLSAKETAVGKSKTDKFFESMNTATTRVNDVAKTWNTVANIVNAFNTNGISLPKIDTNITGGNRDKVKSEKKEKQKENEAKQKRAQQEAQRDKVHAERQAKKEQAAKEAAEAEAKTESKSEPMTGTVVGEGTSKGSQSRKTNTGPVYDADFVDVDAPVSSVPAVIRDNGRNYVNGYLGLPAPKKEER